MKPAGPPSLATSATSTFLPGLTSFCTSSSTGCSQVSLWATRRPLRVSVMWLSLVARSRAAVEPPSNVVRRK
jgi:hypothetical protein